MLELLAICALLCVGFAIVAVIAVVGFFLKIAFKILLLPLGLALGLLKIFFFGLLVLIALAVAPVVVALALVLGLVALPVLFFLGLLGAGWAVAAT